MSIEYVCVKRSTLFKMRHIPHVYQFYSSVPNKGGCSLHLVRFYIVDNFCSRESINWMKNFEYDYQFKIYCQNSAKVACDRCSELYNNCRIVVFARRSSTYLHTTQTVSHITYTFKAVTPLQIWRGVTAFGAHVTGGHVSHMITCFLK